MLARDRAPNHRFTPPGDLHGSGGYGNDKLVGGPKGDVPEADNLVDGGADFDLCGRRGTGTLVSCEQLSL